MREVLTLRSFNKRFKYIAVASPSTVVAVARITSPTSSNLGSSALMVSWSGTHPVHRRERPVEHVVKPFVFARTLDGEQVGGLLDHADEAAVTLRVGADVAQFRIGDVEADAARVQRTFRTQDGLREPPHVLFGQVEKVKGEPLRALGTDAGQFAEFADELD